MKRKIQTNMEPTRKHHRQAVTDDQAEDRISNLPEAIRSHIISLLPMEDAVVTTVLSRSWRHILSSLTTLDFEFARFPQTRFRQAKFVNFIRQTVDHHNGSNLEKFRISFGFFFTYIPLVNEWINFAIECNVRELNLDIPKLEDAVELPSCLFTCESLVVLKLNMNYSELRLPQTIRLRRLKTLHLKWVDFSDGRLTGKLFSSCPVLEDLDIRSCQMFKLKNFDISAPELKSLVIFSCALSISQLKVSAPNLLSFKYVGHMALDYVFENLSSLSEVEINFFGPNRNDYGALMSKMFKGLAGARFMTLGTICIEFLSRSRDLLKFLPIFCNLKHLKLTSLLNEDHIRAITCLLESSPSLECLIVNAEIRKSPFWPIPYTFDWHGYFEKRGLLLECMAHNLKTIEIRNFHGIEDELSFVKFVLMNAAVLERMTIAEVEQELSDMQKILAVRVTVVLYPRASSTVEIIFPSNDPPRA